jgi:hypothetical protein
MQLAAQVMSCDYYRGRGVEKMVFAMFVATLLGGVIWGWL